MDEDSTSGGGGGAGRERSDVGSTGVVHDRTTWWIVMATLLLCSAFVPVLHTSQRVTVDIIALLLDFGSKQREEVKSVAMFWDLLEESPKYGAWLIINGVIGLVLLVLLLVFRRSVTRASIIVIAGFLGYVLVPALTDKFQHDSKVLFYAAGVGVAGMVAGVDLRRAEPSRSYPLILTAVSGGAAALLTLIGIVMTLVSTGPHWTDIVGNVIQSLVRFLPVVSGVLALTMLSGGPAGNRMLRAIVAILGVFLWCSVFGNAIWTAVVAPARGVAPDFSLVLVGEELALSARVVGFTLMLGWGTAELVLTARGSLQSEVESVPR